MIEQQPNILPGVAPTRRYANRIEGAMPALAENLQSSAPGAMVTLYEADLRPMRGPILYFTPHVGSAAAGAVMFGGKSYLPTPIVIEGFEANNRGEMPRPRMRMSNVGTALLSLMLTYQDLVGAIMRRLRTLSRHLDGAPDADPLAIIDTQVYRINRKTAQNPAFVEWELASPLDHEAAIVPKGQFLPNYCLANYRAWNPTENAYDVDTSALACPYAGAAAFDINDQPTTQENDRASKTLGCCRVRFGTNAVLPFMNTPGVGRIR